MRHASHYILMGLLLAGASWTSAASAAGTTLKNISYETRPGGNVELKMDFGNGPVPQPKIFTTGNPPRIATSRSVKARPLAFRPLRPVAAPAWWSS
jgi:type IV pilus assembly protein PilQ